MEEETHIRKCAKERKKETSMITRYIEFDWLKLGLNKGK